MNLPTRTISPTGNKLSQRRGFTFVEVMVALVVLTAGIVLVYKSFFLCVDYLSNLTCRLYASTLLDEKIGDIEESFAQWPAQPLDFGDAFVIINVNHRPIRFTYDIGLAPLVDVKSVWQLNVKLSWFDGRRSMHAGRSAYMLK